MPASSPPRPARVILVAVSTAAALGLGLLSRLESPAHAQATGTIVGIVTTDVEGPADPVPTTADQAICGTTVTNERLVVDGSGGVANAVVRLPDVTWDEAPPPPEIRNTGCLFVPHVQVAALNDRLTITSDDATLHSTHAYDDLNRTSFNIAMPVPGLMIERPLPRPGILRVECDSHSWMRAWVVVTPDRAVTTGADGRFALRGVPAGSHELAVWHETLAEASRTVEVPAGGTVEVRITLTE